MSATLVQRNTRCIACRMLEEIAGVVLVMLALADVFITVLYARMYGGLFAMRSMKLTAAFFRFVKPAFGRFGSTLMSFLGPVIVVQCLALWVACLTVGMALIIHPALGKAVVTQDGETPKDFISALYAGGNSISIIAAGPFSPRTPTYRIVYLLASLTGFSVLSLLVTYLLQISNSLHRRNTLGLKIELLSTGKGDAAEVIARLGPRGKFETTTSITAELAAETSAVKEAHHFYPVLVYFRFSEPFYAVSRFTLVSLDTYSLLASAVEEEEHGWLVESASLLQLWEASKHMLESLTKTYSPGRGPSAGSRPSEDDLRRWEARWYKALARLRAAGIATRTDERAGFARYAELRARWDGLAFAMGKTLGFSWEEIDVAGSTASPAVIERQPWSSRGGSSSPSFSS